MSTSIASDVELASTESGDVHAAHVHATHLSLVPSPDGTLAASGFILERSRLRYRVDAALIRTLDALLAALLLLVLLPFIVLSALAVRLDSPGPAFFRVDRIGWRGGRLRMLKLRKMHDDAAGPALTMDNDERFTRLGPLLAKLKLDEIPQLWHVLTGDMSLVGPRPLWVEEAKQCRGWTQKRLDITPGITGLWQVLGRSDIPFDEMVKLDYMYVTGWSLSWDLKLLLQTVPAVLEKRGAY